MSSSKVSNKQRHDSFIKKAMSNPKVARAFFKCHLPSRIQEKIDFDTLAMQKDSFVDNTLGISFADMLFTVRFGKETGYLYLLVEHQSKADE